MCPAYARGKTRATARADERAGLREHQPLRCRVPGRGELCEQTPKLQVHQIRKLAVLDRPGQPRLEWMQAMAKRRRKTLVVCATCHAKIRPEQPTAITT